MREHTHTHTTFEFVVFPEIRIAISRTSYQLTIHWSLHSTTTHTDTHTHYSRVTAFTAQRDTADDNWHRCEKAFKLIVSESGVSWVVCVCVVARSTWQLLCVVCVSNMHGVCVCVFTTQWVWRQGIWVVDIVVVGDGDGKRIIPSHSNETSAKVGETHSDSLTHTENQRLIY